MKSFDKKICVVTGAASGIGRACAMALAAEGAHVVMGDVRSDMLNETLRLITDAGGKAEAHIVDVADRAIVYALADDVETRLGGADLIINNAGVALVAPVAELSLDDLEWMMSINFWGVVYGTQAFLPQMQRRNRGHIANVSSVFGLFSVPSQAAYNASKFAVLGYTDALRHDLADSPIGVTYVLPGGINTNIVRHARFAQSPTMEAERAEAIDNFTNFVRTQPDKAAQTILRGIKRGKVRVLIGGDAVYMDIARRLFPTHYLRFIPGIGRDRDTDTQ